LALSSGVATAQHCHGGGYGGQNYSTPRYNYSRQFVYSGYRGYAPGYQNYGTNYGYSGHSYYHDTSHYDYHAPSLQWHGNHFDAVPGHYDFHQTGHFHH
jgi:hypothetical protein